MKQIERMAIRMRAPEITYEYLRFPRKSKLVFLRKFLVMSRSKVMSLPLARRLSKISLVTKIEVSREVMIPMIRVVAKPWTGPEPKMKRTIPVSIVVS